MGPAEARSLPGQAEARALRAAWLLAPPVAHVHLPLLLVRAAKLGLLPLLRVGRAASSGIDGGSTARRGHSQNKPIAEHVTPSSSASLKVGRGSNRSLNLFYQVLVGNELSKKQTYSTGYMYDMCVLADSRGQNMYVGSTCPKTCNKAVESIRGWPSRTDNDKNAAALFSATPSCSSPPHLIAVERPSPAVWLLAPPRNNVHLPLQFVSRAEAGPLALEPVAGLPLALGCSAAATSHIDHGGRLVERAKLGLFSLVLGV